MFNFILGCFVVLNSNSPTYYTDGPDSYLRWYTPQGSVRRDISNCIKEPKIIKIFGDRIIKETCKAGEHAKLGLK
jgi:hypothetical protein